MKSGFVLPILFLHGNPPCCALVSSKRRIEGTLIFKIDRALVDILSHEEARIFNLVRPPVQCGEPIRLGARAQPSTRQRCGLAAGRRCQEAGPADS
jgi:hypothetical protein